MAKARESEDDKRSREIAAYWKDQIKECETDPKQKHWKDRCKRIIQAYRDDRTVTDTAPDINKNLNLFWSNTETQKPVIYSKMPQPIVERRFLDRDPIGKIAAQILERALRYEMPSSGFHHSLKLCRDDYLLVGRAVPWVRYNPQFGESISIKQTANNEEDEEGTDKQLKKKEEDQVEETTEQVESESLCIDYIQWDDFYILGRPRIWAETEAIAKRVFMSRYDLKKKFGEEIGSKIPLDHSPGDNEQDKSARKKEAVTAQQATVYEIWCKYEDKVYFVAKEYDLVCEEVENPLGLEGFFPCPRPIFATTTNDTLVPVPDYIITQDQYLQINDLTKRIEVLTDACKVVGTYDAANKNIARIFTEGKEPNLIPVDQWAMYAEKGGLKGSIDFVPIDLIAKTVTELVQVRRQIIEDLDRLTGIWDIMRGESDPEETKGAQQLKQQNGMGRLGERQEEFARLCRDTICIMGEIIAEHYDPKTLIQVSGALFDEGLIPAQPAPIPPQALPPVGAGAQPQPMSQAALPPQAMNGATPGNPMSAGAPIDPEQYKLQMIAQALELLKSQKLRGFRIDIETDSTIQPDANADKSAVNEFIIAITKFIEISAQISATVPEFAPLGGKMLSFAARRYRVGRDLETAIEEFCEGAAQQAQQLAANPKPNSEEIKAQTEQMKAKAEIERQQLQNQGSLQDAQIELESKKIELEMRKIELMMKQIEHNHKVHSANMDLASQAMEMQQPAEGQENGGSSQTPNFAIHPHVALASLNEAAEKIHAAADRIASPRRIVRDPVTGKAVGTEPVQ